MNLRAITGLLVVYLAVCSHSTAAPSSDEKDSKALVQRLYSFSPAAFELANFDNKLNLNKHCELLRNYFSESLVKQPTLNSGCLISNLVSIRFPSLSLENLMDMQSTSRLPKPEISDPQVNADEIAIHVFTSQAKTTYFLKKTDNTWRIVNALVFEKWPQRDETCLGTFLATPSKEQNKFKSEACYSPKPKP